MSKLHAKANHATKGAKCTVLRSNWGRRRSYVKEVGKAIPCAGLRNVHPIDKLICPGCFGLMGSDQTAAMSGGGHSDPDVEYNRLETARSRH